MKQLGNRLVNGYGKKIKLYPLQILKQIKWCYGKTKPIKLMLITFQTKTNIINKEIKWM
jgi:hypothetical protein